ncbi:MAG: nitroreductase family protein [Spirochaetales bacterium]|nr:nitroreductase family protein [Spirochaetales bacterium]
MYTRRSIRRYSNQIPEESLIEELIHAGMMAPSAGNQQPWHFITVKDSAMLHKITEINPYAKMAAEAPAGILVCGDTRVERFPGNWVQDCSAAIQNILLAAHAKGLGAVWTGVFPEEDRMVGFQKAFKLPQGVIPQAFIVLGYPRDEAKTAPVPHRIQPERIHKETW